MLPDRQILDKNPLKWDSFDVAFFFVSIFRHRIFGESRPDLELGSGRGSSTVVPISLYCCKRGFREDLGLHQ